MSTLHSSLYAIAFASCLLLLLAMRQPSARARRGSGYLTALLALQAASFGFEWLTSNPGTPAKSLWLACVMALALLFAPLLWLYARSITEPDPFRFRELPLAHWIPVVVGVVLLLPLLSSVHSGTDFSRADRPAGALYTMIHETMLASVAVFALQGACYLCASLRVLRQHARAARALLSNLEDRELNALRLLIFAVGSHWIVGIARALHPLLLGKDAGYVVLFAACEVMFVVWATVGLLRSSATVDARDRELARSLDEPKYARSALDAPARARIARKLEEAWETLALHRDSRLTLRGLCDRLRENPHYVSQFINQDLETNFFELVNRHRILDAMDALVREPERPVLDIAVEVGFNSKSTFNASFLRHAGTTPTEFRRTKAVGSRLATSDPAG